MKSEVEPFFIINVSRELNYLFFPQGSTRSYTIIVLHCMCIFYVNVFMKTSNLQKLHTKPPKQLPITAGAMLFTLTEIHDRSKFKT